jgi:hypothetical protein
MAGTEKQSEPVDVYEKLAQSVLEAKKSGQWPWPLERLEPVTLVLAEMVISLAGLLKAAQERNTAVQDAADALVLLLHRPDPNKPPDA